MESDPKIGSDEEEPLPDDFAAALGRIVYVGGRVEMHLDRLLAPNAKQPPRRGLSGKSLVKELRKVDDGAGRLAEIIDGYEQQHEWRNHIVHGSHHYSNRALWTWREPTAAKGGAAFSFTFKFDDLTRTADSWQNLAKASHEELHRRDESD